ncbi:STAS domain-containing protein [Mesoterricola sediminis]|uniref:Chemotaxis locus antisigma factor antagonist n=1 Tax=Mesoterricola sediminis TaxID=2927980 RepID=A0AA48HC13_9BACT|nr:STAS domain-containing protein [Mesoterricola sediminis]BDU75528.1 chemotaxis locus antisigma factor antagonist [Mesoterricola sediminis]
MLTFTRSGSTLKLEGELTIFEAAEARARLREELRQAPLELDLSGVAEVDTAGIQVLLWLKREGQAAGTPVPFGNHSPAVVEVLDLLRLAGAFGDTLLLAPTQSPS